eukprot:83085-Pyramimonas_sp.AAC.1
MRLLRRKCARPSQRCELDLIGSRRERGHHGMARSRRPARRGARSRERPCRGQTLQPKINIG